MNETKQDDKSFIRVYGLTKKGENVCVRVRGFNRFVYVELPEKSAESTIAKMAKSKGATGTKLCMRHHLYYLSKKKFPFLKCSFVTLKQLNAFVSSIRYPIFIPGIGRTRVNVHEELASPVLQLISNRNLKMAGWLGFKGRLLENGTTSCSKEYIVDYRDLVDMPDTKCMVVPKVMSFDMEVNSQNDNCMPCNKAGDKIFQISCVFNDNRKILLTLPTCGHIEGVQVMTFDTEKDLLSGFIDLIREEKPNCMIGYNILCFDIPYLMKRCLRYFLLDELRLAGFNVDTPAKMVDTRWTSSAFRDQHFEYIDWEGILLMDLFPIIMRDHKLDNYKLNTVAAKFVGAEKDPLTPKDLFAAYRNGQLTEVGKYCVKDSDLVLQMFEKMQIWVAYAEMAKVCNVNMFTLYTHGQQIKVYSQVYRYCHDNKIVVDTDGYVAGADERYRGAYVIEPVPGYYEDVIPLDFSSLYPSIMQAWNICFSSAVKDESIPDELCNVFEWDDHVGCEHDPKVVRENELKVQIDQIVDRQKALRAERDSTVRASAIYKASINRQIADLQQLAKPLREERDEMVKGRPDKPMCIHRRYRFYKADVQKGVIPTIITDLLEARKNVKNKIKQTDDPDEKVVYDKQQLAYKVSANSMYGTLGMNRGMLAYMPGAMCVTMKGREAIQTAERLLKTKYNAEIVYGDTDCCVGTTPILVKCAGGTMTYKQLKDIASGEWKRINSTKEISPVTEHMVWSDSGWTEIKHIVRCAVTKPVVRVVTHSGEVSCSSEHSLLDDKRRQVSASDLVVGDKLCTADLPLPRDTPMVHKKPRRYDKLARVMGVYFTRCSKTRDEYFLQRHDLDYTVDEWRKMFYVDRYKKVPDCILNGSLFIRRSFFHGFYTSCNRSVYFSNKGAIGSAGLFFLLKSIGFKVSINVRVDKPDMYKLTCSPLLRKQSNVIKKMYELPSDDGYLYDIETGNHHFAAGVGDIVVHNSNYVRFPWIKDARELWDHAIDVAAEISNVYPKPMKLEFEEKIYKKFLIVSKKMYMWQSCGRDGVLDEKVGNKGVVLARRDNSKFIRVVYEKMVEMIFAKRTKEDIIDWLNERLNDLFRGTLDVGEYVITKSVGDTEGEVDQDTSKLGSYKVRALSDDPEKRAKQLNGKTEREFYLSSCPPQVRLAEKMKKRGFPVDPGTRLEFVVLDRNGAKTLGDKVEEIDYFRERRHILRIDPLYYLESLEKPLDQLFKAGLGDPFMSVLEKYRVNHYKTVRQLKSIFMPRIVKMN